MAKSNRVNAESPVHRPKIQNRMEIKYKKNKSRYKTIFVYHKALITIIWKKNNRHCGSQILFLVLPIFLKLLYMVSCLNFI